MAGTNLADLIADANNGNGNLKEAHDGLGVKTAGEWYEFYHGTTAVENLGDAMYAYWSNPVLYPTRVDIAPWASWDHEVDVGTPTRQQSLNSWGGGYLSLTPLPTTEIGWYVTVMAGTYTLWLTGRKAPTNGMWDVYFGSSLVGMFDLAASSASENNIFEFTGISVPTAGTYLVKLVPDDLLPLQLSWISFLRTGSV